NAATGNTATASGTAAWVCSVALLSGANVITVTAKDAANNSGTDTITVTYTPPPSGQRVKDDFDGDGKSDLVWRNASTGDTWLWLMNGNGMISSTYITNMPSAWTIAAAADFDGDGKADLIWRNASTGDTWLWLMNANAPVTSRYLGNLSSAWSLAAVGDFDGDGSADI